MKYRVATLLFSLFLLASGAATARQNGGMLIGGQSSGPPPGPPPGTYACSLGPSVSSIPALAAKASFNTCAINLDFTSPSFSDKSKFVVSCGAANSTPSVPSTWAITLDRYGDQQNLSCADAAIKADPDTGDPQVFYWKWPVSEWTASMAAGGCGIPNPGGGCNNNFTQAELQFPAFGGAGGTPAGQTAWLPNQFYAKIVYRTTSNSWTQPGGGGNPTYFSSLWATTTGNGVSCWIDHNWQEAYAGPTNQPMWDISLDPFSGCGSGSGFNQFYNFTSSNQVNYDFHYHTMEGLVTSDGSSGNIWTCVVWDGNPEGCKEATGQPSQTMNAHNINLKQTMGSASRTMSLQYPFEMYIKSITLYGCASWLTTSCTGTPVTSYP